MQVIKTTQTYATYKNAYKKLEKATGGKPDRFRWMIAATEDGRFAPVVVQDRDQTLYVGLIHSGITVVG